jgi:serine/threonine protein kinase
MSPTNVLGVVVLIAHLVSAAAPATNSNNNNNNPIISNVDQLQSPPSTSSVDMAVSSRTDRSTPNAPQTPWIASGGTLDFPRGVSSVFQLNGTFFIVGGCIDVECVNRSGAISRYDPIEESIVPSTVTQIPMNFLIPSKTPVLPPTQVPVTLAGPTAVVPVASNGLREGALNVETRPWLVGPCALYLAWQGNSLENPTVGELYHGIWGFSLDFSAKEFYERLPDHVPIRANASCQAYGTRIYIVGGLFVDTLEIADTIDAFDTATLQYYPNVQRHVEPIMNPAIAIDNHMMYVVGGQTTTGCSSASHAYMWTSVGADAVPSINSHRQVSFCQSTRVTAYYFSPMYIVNESIPLEMFILPEVPTQVIRRYVLSNTSSSGSTSVGASDDAADGTNSEETQVVELLKAFSFGGTLAVSSFSTMVGTLTVEHLDIVRASAFGPLLAPTWQVQQVAGLGVRHASVMMYLVPYVFFGCGLAIFSIGGADNASMTNHIFERFVGLSMPAIRGAPPVVEIMGQTMNISLQPPMEGYLRLSDNAACVGNTVGTTDEPVSADQQQDPVTFVPLFPADEVYVCFSFGPVDIDQNLTNLLFFSAINAFQPFAVLQHGMLIPTPAPKAALGRSATIIISITVPAGCLMVVLALVLIVRRRFSNRYRELDNSNRQLLDESQDDPKDLIIKQTTSDSRYTVVKRIGEGAFSSVFLVSPKADPSLTYALKFMVCADDRERLEAIKECETINSVQAHPNIIQLMDMFMNYEFGGMNRANSRLDENDQSMLLTSSMHAIQIQHRGAPKSPGAQAHQAVSPPFPPTPNERTPLAGSPRANNAPRRNTTPGGTAINHTNGPTYVVTPTEDVTAAVHNRYLCLVMQYHPSGDLCRYALRRAEEILSQQQRANAMNTTVSNDSLMEWVNARKKSSNTSDENCGPPSLKSSNSSVSRSDLISRHALTERQLLSIAYQVASVLQYLHAQRPPIVHRDLKPENILIKGPMPDPSDPFVPIVVTDFGLAFIQEEHRKSGRGGGTRPYISPESWKGQTTTASDVWGLGCVLYALATQRLTSQTVRVMFQDAKYPNFTQTILTDLIQRQKYSCEFGVFVASILEADPKKRPTAEKLVRMFDVRSMPNVSVREGEDEPGYITFKKDAFGQGGAISLVPPECLENGLVPSADSVADSA